MLSHPGMVRALPSAMRDKFKLFIEGIAKKRLGVFKEPNQDDLYERK